MTERKTKLKECPKCGGRPIRVHDGAPDEAQSYAVMCYRKGHFVVAVGTTESEAAANWNKGKVTEAS